jgi:hypothetical protein
LKPLRTQARPASGGRLGVLITGSGGHATPSPHVDPNAAQTRLTALVEQPLQRPDTPLKTPKLFASTKVLELPGGSFAIPLPIISSSASSYSSGNTPSTASYDGDKTTFWMTAGNSTNEGKDYTPWIQYTFDRVYPLGSMRLVNFNTYEVRRAAKDVDILVSQDGATFTSLGYKTFTLDPMTAPGGTWQSVDLWAAGKVRKACDSYESLRRTFLRCSPPQGPQETWANASITGLNEVQFFSPVPIVSSSASTSLDPSRTPAASYDGNVSTPWMTAGNATNGGKDYTPWIQYAFDRVYALDSMRILRV